MKNPIQNLWFIAASVLLPCPFITAATIASDNASNYTTSTWINGSNGGTGFGTWTLGTNLGNQITNSNGNGGSPNINSTPGDVAFRIARGSSSFVQAERSFTVGGPNASSELASGQSFKFSFDPEIPTNANQAVGIWLTDSGNGERWGIEIGRTAANVNQFRIKNNGSAAIVTTIPTADVDDGMNVTFNLLDSGAWNAAIVMLATDVTYNLSSADAEGYAPLTQSPTGFRFFFASAPSGQNQYFNNFAVVPEPSALSMMALGAVALVFRRRA